MIPQIKKILYTTDLSENARYAFGYTASLANQYGAGITILHVLEDMSSFRDSMVISIIGEDKWQEMLKNNRENVIETIRKRLEKFCEDATAELPSCPFITDEIIVKIGNPVEEILAQAEAKGCDMIVMGTHGHGILADTVIGSTSRRVLRRSKKPVLVIRLPEEKKD